MPPQCSVVDQDRRAVFIDSFVYDSVKAFTTPPEKRKSSARTSTQEGAVVTMELLGHIIDGIPSVAKKVDGIIILYFTFLKRMYELDVIAYCLQRKNT